MGKTKQKPALTTDALRPYVQRALTDPDLRDDLLAAVWNGRIVSESTLSSRINAARVAMGAPPLGGPAAAPPVIGLGNAGFAPPPPAPPVPPAPPPPARGCPSCRQRRRRPRTPSSAHRAAWPGRSLALLGASGSGKSTLSYVLSGRDGYEVTAGSAAPPAGSTNPISKIVPDTAARVGSQVLPYPSNPTGLPNIATCPRSCRSP